MLPAKDSAIITRHAILLVRLVGEIDQSLEINLRDTQTRGQPHQVRQFRQVFLRADTPDRNTRRRRAELTLRAQELTEYLDEARPYILAENLLCVAVTSSVGR